MRYAESKIPTQWRPNVPEGQPGNSPAFQRRGYGPKHQSPEGTAERPLTMVEMSAISRPFGTGECAAHEPGVETPGYFRASLRDKAPCVLASGAEWLSLSPRERAGVRGNATSAWPDALEIASVLFPLTLTLSLGEREQRADGRCGPDGRDANAATSIIRTISNDG